MDDVQLAARRAFSWRFAVGTELAPQPHLLAVLYGSEQAVRVACCLQVRSLHGPAQLHGLQLTIPVSTVG